MHYYDLDNHLYSSNYRHLGNAYSGESIVDADNFISSVYYNSSLPLCFYPEIDTSFDFCLGAFDIPVVSATFASAIIDLAGDDIQLIPVSVHNDPSYYILNTLKTIACVDESRSEVMKWTEADNRPDRMGWYRMVADLKLVRKELGSHMFRIYGWPVLLVVSEPMAEVIRALEINEVVLKPL